MANVLMLVGLGCLVAWGGWRLLTRHWARQVLTGEGHAQFRVFSFPDGPGEGGFTRVDLVSVTFPPHNRRRVIRAILAWARVNHREVINIKVNSSFGGYIYSPLHANEPQP